MQPSFSQHGADQRLDWAGPLCHPVTLAALLVLAINDHWLKGAGLLPGWLTGKLSDVAGLLAAPLVILAVARALAALVSRVAPGRRHAVVALARSSVAAWIAAAVVAAGFVAANTSTAFNGWLAGWFGVKVMDPSDLLALPSVLVGARVGASMGSGRPGRPVAVGALLAAAVALGATSPARLTYPRDFARWKLARSGASRYGALGLSAWVNVTSKTGFALSLCLVNHGQQPVRVALRSAAARIGRPRRLSAMAKPVAVRSLAPAQGALLHLPFVFDNNRAWNRGWHAAEVTLGLEVDNQTITRRLHLEQQRPKYHRAVRRYRPRRTPSTSGRRADPHTEVPSECQAPQGR